MEVPNDPTSTDSTSLDVILDQMEVSTDPDINSLDIVTACAEELILGGEVEVRAAVEVRKPSDSQRPDAESTENIAAGTDDLIFQGGAQGEEAGRMDEAIGMEIEVPRKSSSSSDLQSPIKDDQSSPEPADHGECTVAGNTAGEEVGQNNVMESPKEVREKDTQRERRHNKGLYIPPVTEWRDLLDSQDVIREFAKNVEEEGGSVADNDSVVEGAAEGDEQRGGTEGPTEDGGGRTSRDEVMATDVSEMTTEEEGNGYEKEADEMLEVVEMERDDEGPCSQPPAPQDTAGEGTGQPDHLELFVPPHDLLYRQASLSSRATTTAGVSRDLEVAEHFLEIESDLLMEAKWVPDPPVDGPRLTVTQEDLSTTHTPIRSTRTRDVAQPAPSRTRRALELASTAPRELPTTAPRELATTAPRELATTAPRELATTVPRELATTAPRELATTAPRELATTAPRELATTAPRELVTTAPRELATTAPRELVTTAPRELATTAQENWQLLHQENWQLLHQENWRLLHQEN